MATHSRLLDREGSVSCRRPRRRLLCLRVSRRQHFPNRYRLVNSTNPPIEIALRSSYSGRQGRTRGLATTLEWLSLPRNKARRSNPVVILRGGIPVQVWLTVRPAAPPAIRAGSGLP